MATDVAPAHGVTMVTVLDVRKYPPAGITRVLEVGGVKTVMGQLMRLWYLSHRRPAKIQASLRFSAVLPDPLLFAHITYGSRRRVRPKIRHLVQMDGSTCAFEEWVYGRRKVL